MTDTIHIDRLELDCIVGTWSHERKREQRVRLDLQLYADLAEAGRSGRIALTADYDRVAREVVELLRFRQYYLIEMAAEEISAMLLSLHPALTAIAVRIEKPGALEGRARAAAVRVHRDRSMLFADSGQAALRLRTRDAVLETHVLAPGEQLTAEAPFEAAGLLWPASGTLSLDGGEPFPVELPLGARRDTSRAPLRPRNSGTAPAELFRCWCRDSAR